MHSFRDMKIGKKLILLLAMPIIALLSFSTQAIFDKAGEAETMASLQEVSQLAVHISALVHETQKERGASALYLGSKGQKFGPELQAQRVETDKRLDELQSFLTGFAVQDYSEELRISLEQATRQLLDLDQTRRASDGLSASSGAIIGYYTGVNASLIEIISTMAKISDQAELLLRISAYVNFLESKERAGIERAVLSNTFARDAFGPGMLNKFINLVADQGTFGKVFQRFATQAQKKAFLAKMDHPAVAETERMRQVAMERPATGGFGIEAPAWFARQTEKINLLK
ncbi:MAG: nitrate- and nitrite sensing domain-containing protein, partial [Candidatus Latescibacteria bacterium]|nr:nitrate- and nitrite sensing domain-containing protein [Candidatus Latescibacterota bacterium]